MVAAKYLDFIGGSPVSSAYVVALVDLIEPLAIHARCSLALSSRLTGSDKYEPDCGWGIVGLSSLVSQRCHSQFNGEA